MENGTSVRRGETNWLAVASHPTCTCGVALATHPRARSVVATLCVIAAAGCGAKTNEVASTSASNGAGAGNSGIGGGSSTGTAGGGGASGLAGKGGGGAAGMSGSAAGAPAGNGVCGSLEGSELLVPLPSSATVADLVVDGEDLFYALAAPTPTVFHVALPIGAATPFLAAWQTAQLAIDATTVYALHVDGGVVAVARAGGKPVPFPGTGTQIAPLPPYVAFVQAPATLAFVPASGVGAPLFAPKLYAIAIATAAGFIVSTGGGGLTMSALCAQGMEVTSVGPAGAASMDRLLTSTPPVAPGQCGPDSVMRLVAAAGDRGCIVQGVTRTVVCANLTGPPMMNEVFGGPLVGIPRALRVAGDSAYAIATFGGEDLLCSSLERAPLVHDAQPNTVEVLAPVAGDSAALAISAGYVYFAAPDGIRRRAELFGAHGEGGQRSWRSALSKPGLPVPPARPKGGRPPIPAKGHQDDGHPASGRGPHAVGPRATPRQRKGPPAGGPEGGSL